MNYHNITHDDMKNGEGLRVVLWTAGCAHACIGCHNTCTWNPDNGLPFTEWEEAELFEWLLKPWTQGITFSGGDPMHPSNRDKIGELAQKIKKLYPQKDIWLYTGYTLMIGENNTFIFFDKDENTVCIPWLENIDVLVDGPFKQDVREQDIREHKKVLWRGSSNQRIIDVKDSLKTGSIVCRKG